MLYILLKTFKGVLQSVLINISIIEVLKVFFLIFSNFYTIAISNGYIQNKDKTEPLLILKNFNKFEINLEKKYKLIKQNQRKYSKT